MLILPLLARRYLVQYYALKLLRHVRATGLTATVHETYLALVKVRSAVSFLLEAKGSWTGARRELTQLPAARLQGDPPHPLCSAQGRRRARQSHSGARSQGTLSPHSLNSQLTAPTARPQARHGLAAAHPSHDRPHLEPSHCSAHGSQRVAEHAVGGGKGQRSGVPRWGGDGQDLEGGVWDVRGVEPASCGRVPWYVRTLWWRGKAS